MCSNFEILFFSEKIWHIWAAPTEHCVQGSIKKMFLGHFNGKGVRFFLTLLRCGEHKKKQKLNVHHTLSGKRWERHYISWK